MEKVVRGSKVAVLVSGGYGAGWYSWNRDYKELLFHPKLVEMVEDGKRDEITDEFVGQLLGVEGIYTGGKDGLRIAWLEEGTAFDIDEYDGAESIITYDNIKLIA